MEGHGEDGGFDGSILFLMDGGWMFGMYWRWGYFIAAGEIRGVDNKA